MTTIGASLIVKNEEVMLEKCLKSLKGFDEIVVLDTGSTDKTCEIARKFTDKVYENVYEWNDDFAEARNKALSYNTTDWVFFIDADEWLGKGAISHIRKAIPKIKQVASFTAMDNVSQLFKTVRLVKRTPKIYWKGAIHNFLNTLADYDTGISLNFGHSPAHTNDPDRAFRILKKEAYKTKRPREKFYLAREYGYRKQWIEAISWYDDYLKEATWGPEMAEANLQRAKAYWNLGNLKEAQSGALEAIRINANFKEAIIYMAAITGPKNSAFWKKAAVSCTNEDVLFIRTCASTQI